MKRNKFSLSNDKLATFSMGELVPVGLMEVLPGDTIQQATSALVRVSPLNAPIMHPVHIKIHHWFVPHRLVWTNWEKFITGGPDGNDTHSIPTITPNTGTGYAVGSLADYLGLPTGVDDQPHSALPFRGYSLIWNEWYRDQDLQTALTVSTADGPDMTTNITLQNVCWEKDYFTSSRPWTQKGSEVTLPLGTSAPVVGTTSNASPVYTTTGGGTHTIVSNAAGSTAIRLDANAAANSNLIWQDPKLKADLTTATAASVNTIREAFALQRYKEARARYGSRYTEYLRYLGVKSSDARLQRPEYLGGGKQTLQFSEVVQTATDSLSAVGVGALRGHGIGALRSNRYRRFFEEHGYVFTFMYVLPKTIYGNGLQRHWSRTSKEDFWQKELEHIGQQEVLNKELYWGDSGPNDVFGYQDRYDEYRRQESSISGEFRNSTANFWHYARIFGSDVTLNSAFVKSDPTTRTYQSTSTDNLYVMVHHSIQARRMLSKFANPITY